MEPYQFLSSAIPRHHTDILRVSSPSFRTPRSNHEHELSTLVLSIGKVLEGVETVSASTLLLSLPDELLEAILLLLEWPDLRSLALASRICCRLARSRLFKKVVLGYSDADSLLASQLVMEGAASFGGLGSSNRHLTVGLSIRHLTIATLPARIDRRHGIELWTIRKLEADEQGRRLADASRGYGRYITDIELALSRGALPNLQIVEWHDYIFSPKSVFDAIACSAAVHLTLPHLCVSEVFEITTPPGGKWPLEPLRMFLVFEQSNANPIPLALSILRACAGTLERLDWEGGPSLNHVKEGVSCSFPDSGCQFPRLRSLGITLIKLTDRSILDAFLGPGTKVRELHLSPWFDLSSVDGFLEDRGQIRSLRTLVAHIPLSPLLRFLQHNTQISKLMIEDSIHTDLMSQLLALLPSFESLESLSLTWREDSLPEHDLESIGTLTSLRQLCLSAGHQLFRVHTWLANHDVMRKHLSGLRNLRNLAFSRDTYLLLDERALGYYDQRFVFRNLSESFVFRNPSETERRIENDLLARPLGSFKGDNDDERRHFQREEAWIAIHRTRMLTQALEYRQCLPSLTWLYIGKYIMGFRPNEVGQQEAYPLSHNLDRTYSEEKESQKLWKTLRTLVPT